MGEYASMNPLYILHGLNTPTGQLVQLPQYLYITHVYIILMSQPQNEAKETAPTAGAAEQPQKEKESKPVVMKFDKLSETSQMQVLQNIVDEKKPKMDAQFLYEELTKNGIAKIPSENIIRIAFESRKQFATGALGFLKAKEALLSAYDSALKEGFLPREARKLVYILIAQNGQVLSDRTVRRYLPEEAKKMEHEPTAAVEEAQTKQAERVSDGTEGTTEIILTGPEFKELVELWNKGTFTARLYIKGKRVVKVKTGVVTEQAATTTGTTAPREQATNATTTTAAAPTVKGGKKTK